MALDVREDDAPWASEAIANPASAPNGLPVISLPCLALLKMRASRGIGIGDLTRVLGAADDDTIAEVGRVIANHLPDGVEDLDGADLFRKTGIWADGEAANPYLLDTR